MSNVQVSNSNSILLIEDNELNSDMLSRRLFRSGYQVSIAETGRQGLSAFAKGPPDVILLDIRLPDLTGEEVARTIRSMPGGDSVKIIAVTGDALVEVAERALAAGCDSFLTKPVTFKALIAEIERLLVN